MKATRRFCLLLACLLLLVPIAAGCKPRLSLKYSINEGVIGAPVLRGTQYAKEHNQRLFSLYAPLLLAVQTLRNEGFDVALRYRIEFGEQTAVLHTTLAGNKTQAEKPSVTLCNGAAVALPDLCFDDRGNLFGAEQWDEHRLADTEFLKDLLLLSALGVGVSFSGGEDVATERGFAARAAELIEGLSGQVIDTGGVLPAVTDAVSAKAYRLGLYKYYDTMPNLFDAPLWPTMLPVLAEGYANSLYETKHTDLGRPASVRDLMDYLDIMFSPTGLLKGGAGVRDILPSWRGRLTEPLTRQSAASLLKQCFDALGVKPERDAYMNHAVSDTKSADVRFLLGYDLMSSYPGFETFSPNLDVRLYQLSGIAGHFASRVFDFALGETADEPKLTLRQVSRLLASLAAYCLDSGGANEAAVRTINDRPYAFYARQFNTGKYSDVNCMPTLSYMCLKWQNGGFDKTPQQIRAATDPKGTGGWTLWMAKQALDDNGGRYESWQLAHDAQEQNIQKMVSELDRGRVLFCMIHEGDLSHDGHCMLIYGYEKRGESLWFFAHDPGLGSATDAFGKPLGEGRKLEAHYAQWITGRWTFEVLSILP
jgi:hypothetical protein